jgi:hypothetical protein
MMQEECNQWPPPRSPEMKVLMTHLESAALADVICAELDPLMTANGFLHGQIGIGTDIGIVYCAPYEKFRRRFPHLAPTIHHSDEGACTDLNIRENLSAAQEHAYMKRLVTPSAASGATPIASTMCHLRGCRRRNGKSQ